MLVLLQGGGVYIRDGTVYFVSTRIYDNQVIPRNQSGSLFWACSHPQVFHLFAAGTSPIGNRRQCVLEWWPRLLRRHHS